MNRLRRIFKQAFVYNMHYLTQDIEFPNVNKANTDGLLAIGGDLSSDRLIYAYRHGIFPWFGDEDPILWWSPDPRFVLFPEHLKVSKSIDEKGFSVGMDLYGHGIL